MSILMFRALNRMMTRRTMNAQVMNFFINESSKIVVSIFSVVGVVIVSGEIALITYIAAKVRIASTNNTIAAMRILSRIFWDLDC